MSYDTPPEVTAIHEDIFRKMTSAQRLRLALEMSESLREVARAGVRSRKPELSDDEVSRELLYIMYGFVLRS